MGWTEIHRGDRNGPVPITLYSIHCILYSVYYTLYSVQCTLYSRGCSKITDFFAGGVRGSLYIIEHCCKVSAKNNDRYPPANAVLCLHLKILGVNYVAIRGCRGHSRDPRRRAF